MNVDAGLVVLQGQIDPTFSCGESGYAVTKVNLYVRRALVTDVGNTHCPAPELLIES